MANSRPWYSWANYALPDPSTSATTLAKSYLWALKAAMMGNVTGPDVGPNGSIPGAGRWTLFASSDGVTAGIDATDRWLTSYDATKLVRASSGAHSWIVLYSAALGLWFTIDWLSSADEACFFVLAKAAPTGGSTSARPTSTNEVGWTAAHTFIDTASWTGGKCHYTVDASGNFYFFASKNTVGILACTAVQTLVNLRHSSDAFPYVLINEYGASGILREADTKFYRAGGATDANCSMKTKTAGAASAVQASALSYNANTTQSIVQLQAGSNPTDLLYDKWPVEVAMVTTTIGPKGELPDCSTIAPFATNSPARFPTSGDIERIATVSTAVPLTVVPLF